MFCTFCGTYLPDSATYCSNYGKRQQGKVDVRSAKSIPAQQWERCEIMLFLVKKSTGFLFGLNLAEFRAIDSNSNEHG
jgi:hypothetical protein